MKIWNGYPCAFFRDHKIKFLPGIAEFLLQLLTRLAKLIDNNL
jgi:hypothetical protein